MWLIITLVLVGLLLLLAELVLLPGISVAGIGAFLALIAAVFYAYIEYGALGGTITLTIVVILAILMVVISLRANTWQRLALKSTVDSTSGETPEKLGVKIGDVATTKTRLAPMGKVQIGENTLEARSIDAYVDPRQKVEVIGFENMVVLVMKKRTS